MMLGGCWLPINDPMWKCSLTFYPTGYYHIRCRQQDCAGVPMFQCHLTQECEVLWVESEEPMTVSQLSLDVHPVVYLGQAPLCPTLTGIYSAYSRRNMHYHIIQGEIRRWGLWLRPRFEASAHLGCYRTSRYHLPNFDDSPPLNSTKAAKHRQERFVFSYTHHKSAIFLVISRWLPVDERSTRRRGLPRSRFFDSENCRHGKEK